MDGDAVTRKDFDELKTLVEENNRLLKNMRRVGRIAFWFKVVIWTVVLVAPLFLIPYLLPYIPALSNVPGLSAASSSTGSSLFGLPSPAEVQEFLHPTK